MGRLHDIKAEIAELQASGAVPIRVLMHPSIWAALKTEYVATGRARGEGPTGLDVLGLPVDATCKRLAAEIICKPRTL